MNRKEFLSSIGIFTLSGLIKPMNTLNTIIEKGDATETMPLLFVGHGSPMNAIEDNIFSREMKKIGKQLAKPKAILMVSAHWETKGTFVTGQERPSTIHDFGGFPKELFDVQYPAPGSKWLGEETKNNITSTSVGFDTTWGI